MKKFISSILVILVLLITPSAALAAPFNAAEKNPQVVAFYTSGTHGIVGEPETHTGIDLVMKTGESGNFQQWFYGDSTETDDPIEGDHSVWQNVGDATSCTGGAVLVTKAYPSWGDYLEPGANYCVRTNDYHVQD